MLEVLMGEMYSQSSTILKHIDECEFTHVSIRLLLVSVFQYRFFNTRRAL